MAPVPKTVDSIRRALAALRSDLERLDVASLAVFGSVARDEATEHSDVDVLVEFRGAATLARYMELKALLERVLGQRVDLVTDKGLRDRLRPAVERDAIRVA
jgi:predicted nucleotidyltransferase